ncbi:MAG: hypothetical protein P8J87_09480 [Verrucomicrobiales bacterium]|nr:hypothetical protein [Verrucomicrobiales bacterium]
MKRLTTTFLAASIAFLSIAAFTSCETTSVNKRGKDNRPIAQKLNSATNLRGY